MITRPRRDGSGYGQGRRLTLNGLAQSTAKGVTPQDRMLARLILAAGGPGYRAGNTLPQEPEMLADLLNRLLASQRLHWQSLEGPALRQGPPRRCRIGWSADDKGRQVPALHVLGEADDTPARHPAGADHPSAAQTEAEPLAGTAGARRPGLSGL